MRRYSMVRFRMHQGRTRVRYKATRVPRPANKQRRVPPAPGTTLRVTHPEQHDRQREHDPNLSSAPSRDPRVRAQLRPERSTAESTMLSPETDLMNGSPSTARSREVEHPGRNLS